MMDYLCRGPLPLRVQQLKAILLRNGEKATAMLVDQLNRGRSDDEPYVLSLANTPTPGTTEKQRYWLSDGTQIEDLIVKGCGYSLTEAIRMLPRDGQSYIVMCPECGTTGEIQTIVEEADG